MPPVTCEACDAALGPWEASRRGRCLSCGPLWGQIDSASARITTVLERSPIPLYVWDIQRRTAERRYQRPALTTTAQTLVRPEYCWAGSSLYGLYRHGLIPGARDLGVVAATLLLRFDGYLSQAQIHFVMRAIGYRFAIGSLGSALTRAHEGGLCIAYTDGTFAGKRDDERGRRRVERALGFRAADARLDPVYDRLDGQIADALVELKRRIAA